jgi:hypothetical protein
LAITDLSCANSPRHARRGETGFSVAETTAPSSGGDGAGGGDPVVVDDLAGAVFTLAAAIGHGQVGLDSAQRIRATIYDLANLAITDSVTQADVHLAQSIRDQTIGGMLNTNANDCQLIRNSPPSELIQRT